MHTIQGQRGSAAPLMAGVFGLLSILFLIFGIWAFNERGTYKNNVDDLVADQIAVAVQEAESAKEAEFVEREKAPNKVYTASEVFGSTSFSYPKTWSLFAIESTGGNEFSVLGAPGIVPAISSGQPYAVRMDISGKSYDTEVSSFQRKIESGAIKSSAYRPEKLPEILGVRLTGEIDTGLNGSMVLLPLRDKTIKISTESTEFLNDFTNTILPSIDYTP